MAISITKNNDSNIKSKDLMVVFTTSSHQVNSITKNNHVFIYDETNRLIGINIFNYLDEYHEIQEGYHSFSDENFYKIANKYPIEMKNTTNDSFLQLGTIKEIYNHPKNNKLKVLTVKISDQNYQIITNLTNLILKATYLFALCGAILANSMIIKESKIHDIKSQGMICSYKSLGIPKEGIIEIKKFDGLQKYIF